MLHTVSQAHSHPAIYPFLPRSNMNPVSEMCGKMLDLLYDGSHVQLQQDSDSPFSHTGCAILLQRRSFSTSPLFMYTEQNNGIRAPPHCPILYGKLAFRKQKRCDGRVRVKCDRQVLSKALSIRACNAHPLYSEYKVLPSGHCLCVPWTTKTDTSSPLFLSPFRHYSKCCCEKELMKSGLFFLCIMFIQ